MNRWFCAKDVDSADLIAFLVDNELAALNLIDRFFDTSVNFDQFQPHALALRAHEKDWKERIVIASNGGQIEALLAFSSNGFLFALATKSPSETDWAEGLRLLDRSVGRIRKRIFALLAKEELGEKIAAYLLLTVVHHNLYLVMQLPEANLPLASARALVWPPLQPRSSSFAGLQMRSCDHNDLDDLLDLQIAYEAEEVIIPGQVQRRELSRAQLLRNINSQRTVAAFINDQAIAKASTNAQTWNWIQIGGVYTMPAWRGKSIAQQLMKLLLEDILSTGYSSALFVKQNNQSARKVYENLHFQTVGDLSIRYY